MFKDNATLNLIGTIMAVGVMIGCIALFIPAAMPAVVPTVTPAVNAAPPGANVVPPAGDPETGASAPESQPPAPLAEDGGLVEAPVEPADLTVRLPALSLDLAAYSTPPADFSIGGDLPPVPDGTILHVVGLVARVEGGRITMRLLKVEVARGLYFYVPLMRDGAPVVLGTTMASFDAIILGGH